MSKRIMIVTYEFLPETYPFADCEFAVLIKYDPDVQVPGNIQVAQQVHQGVRVDIRLKDGTLTTNDVKSELWRNIIANDLLAGNTIITGGIVCKYEL